MLSEEGFHMPEWGEHFVNVLYGPRCPDKYTLGLSCSIQ